MSLHRTISTMAISSRREPVFSETSGTWPTDSEVHLRSNVWCRFILSDPEAYPDPDVFDPERFLGEDKQPDPRDACFGYGRRSCPGVHLAELTIFTCVTMALATLDVSRYIENGEECVPGYDVEEGIVR